METSRTAVSLVSSVVVTCALLAFPVPPVGGADTTNVPACSLPGPLPSSVKIISPPPELAPEIAAFSGVWEGRWDGVDAARIAIVQIDANQAFITYAFQNDSRTPTRPAQVLPDRQLQWRYSDSPDAGMYTFTMAPDLASIIGVWEFRGKVRRVTVTRCK